MAGDLRREGVLAAADLVGADVTDGLATAELDDDELIEAVMGPLDETSGFTATLRALVSIMP